jgi:hypothetical protein
MKVDPAPQVADLGVTVADTPAHLRSWGSPSGRERSPPRIKGRRAGGEEFQTPVSAQTSDRHGPYRALPIEGPRFVATVAPGSITTFVVSMP